MNMRKITSVILSAALVISALPILPVSAAELPEPIGHYEFNGNLRNTVTGEEDLTKVTSSLGSGSGSALFTDDGYCDEALSLDGTYGLSLGSVGADFTVSATVRVQSPKDATTVFFKNMGSSSSQKWAGVLSANGTPTLWTHDGSSYKWSTVAAATSTTTGTWATYTYTESGGIGALYVDGIKIGGGSVVSANTADIYLGATYWSSDILTAAVDELYIYDSALSENEVAAHYALNTLTLPERTARSISLPTSIGSVTIEWSSSNEAVIANDGTVTQPEDYDTDVIMTATITINGEQTTREFFVTVPARTESGGKILDYSFDSISGGVIPDESGNGNDAAVYGNMTVPGGYAYFDGTDDYIEMPKGILSGCDNLTIDIKLQPEIAQTNMFTWNFGNSSTTGYFFLNTSRPSTNALRVGITKASYGDEEELAYPNGGIASGTWARVTVVIEEKRAEMYVDGELKASADLTIAPSDLGETTQNWIAKSPYSGDAYFKGYVDYFRIYSRALSADEIVAIDDLEAAAGQIKLPSQAVTDLELPLSANGINVTWQSNNGAVIAANGTVTRPADNDVTVTLTATFEKNGQKLVKTYRVTVLADNITGIRTVTADTFTGYIPVLPDTVTAERSNGETINLAVTWDINEADFARAGKAEVTGTVYGTDKSALAEVTITDFGTVQDINISADKYAIPTLPEKVTVNGTEYPVTWDNISPVKESTAANGTVIVQSYPDNFYTNSNDVTVFSADSFYYLIDGESTKTAGTLMGLYYADAENITVSRNVYSENGKIYADGKLISEKEFSWESNIRNASEFTVGAQRYITYSADGGSGLLAEHNGEWRKSSEPVMANSINGVVKADGMYIVFYTRNNTMRASKLNLKANGTPDFSNLTVCGMGESIKANITMLSSGEESAYQVEDISFTRTDGTGVSAAVKLSSYDENTTAILAVYDLDGNLIDADEQQATAAEIILLAQSNINAYYAKAFVFDNTENVTESFVATAFGGIPCVIASSSAETATLVEIINPSDADVSGTLIIAAYDDNGVMMSVETQNVTVKANEFDEISAQANSKVYFWNSLTDMVPLAAVK